MWVREHGRGFQVPEELTQLVMSGQLVDYSYHNDLCPKFAMANSIDEYNDISVCIFSDHPDEGQRECEAPRFAVSYIDNGDGIYENLLMTDEFIEVLNWINQHKNFNKEQFKTLLPA